MPFPYAVAVVLDLEFGDRLSELAARLPVWIVDTPANRRAAQKHWGEHPGLSDTEGVTTFKVDLSSSAEVWSKHAYRSRARAAARGSTFSRKAITSCIDRCRLYRSRP